MYEFEPSEFKLLIVDDIVQNIQVLGSYLRNEGFLLSFATDGKKALDMIFTDNFDLILLDVMMPEMNGFEVCKILKADNRSKDIPVIFLTAKSETESIVEGFRIGAVDYITKPFKTDELFVRIQTHLELKQTKEKLEESNRTKDKFFSIIAQDLKTPFKTILDSSKLIVDYFDKLDINQIKEHINEFHQEGEQLYKLMNNLLQWSQIQTRNIECNYQNIVLSYLVNNNISLLSANATQKKITLNSNIDESVYIFADTDMINSTIRNLLTNAIKFTHEGGQIEISSKTIDNEEHITIADNGIGISKENQKSLFKIDTQKKFFGTAKETGTGLGLVLCQEYLKMNNGKIWVESEIDKGSQFIFTLPKTQI